MDYNNRDLFAFEVLEINMDLMNGDTEACAEGDAHIVS